MPEVTMEGQKKLKAARVLMRRHRRAWIASGFVSGRCRSGYSRPGRFRRGGLHQSATAGASLHQRRGPPKLDSAIDKLTAINPFVEIKRFDTYLNSQNALEIFSGFDIIADGTDNFATRYLVNDACVLSGKPNVYASIFRFEGQASIFATEDGPCYRCLYPEPPPPGLVPSCAEGGVLGVLPGLLGVIQATEVIKLILGVGEPLIGRLVLVDALAMRFRELRVRKNPECPVCGANPTVKELIDYNQFCGIRGEESEASTSAKIPEIQPEELKRRLDAKEDIFVLDVREPHEYQIVNIGGHLIPLGDLPKRVHELDSSREIVVHCKSGAQRSAKAVDFLRQSGFKRAEPT
jgi:sulfur-carrier protein adenylyltransferase/sulfurtransferase